MTAAAATDRQNPHEPASDARPAGARRVRVRQMDRSLDFYLALGFDVSSTADGWVLLRTRSARVRSEDVVLVHDPEIRARPTTVLGVCATEVAALRSQLRACGAVIGVSHDVSRASDGFIAIDPDGNIVVVTGSPQQVRAAPPATAATRSESLVGV
ncbi:hypothetical protein [Actinokineospora sp. NBRC 105648]|uniref:hypothetical protein n=1 Tax=Actinokineospora sp. NBRC 105648 TaxID=3032206 RepID=UPI0024A1C0BA|nr:hypothetical protein [Actinokineospora sp. NBRC 105648]GLZ39899.1 hypothetical protein Acsp05_35230 [Actinokineospora sp. NBRC 105648]